MIFDCHVHTELSSDSRMKLEDGIEVAKSKNLGLIITEHLDLAYRKEGFRVDLDEFFNRYSHYRGENLLLGIEMGIAWGITSELLETSKKYPFDYILGSIHRVDDLDIVEELLDGRYTDDVAFEKYLTHACKIIDEYSFIDALAHIDFISRYAKSELYYDDYKELFDDLLNKLIKNNICLEVNTRRLKEPIAYKNLSKIYSRYKELGGNHIVLSSDAHAKNAIGFMFDEAIDLLNSIGLKQVYFKNREMFLIS